MHNLKSDIDATVRDAQDMSGGPEKAAQLLMRDVEMTRQALGGDTKQFSMYMAGVTKELQDRNLLPELSLGYLNNNFDRVDVDKGDGITKVELYVQQQRASNMLEKQLLGHAINGFEDVRSTHDSSKWNPFGDDEKGITRDDVKGKLDELDTIRRARLDSLEGVRERDFVEDAAQDLLKNDGRLFAKLARADADGDKQTLDKDDLEALLRKDDNARTFGSARLNDREWEIVNYLSKNWDSEPVKLLRADMVSFDSNGNEYIHKGEREITIDSLQRAVGPMPAGFEPVSHPHVERKPQAKKEDLDSRHVPEDNAKPKLNQDPNCEKAVQSTPAERKVSEQEIIKNTQAYLKGDNLTDSDRQQIRLRNERAWADQEDRQRRFGEAREVVAPQPAQIMPSQNEMIAQPAPPPVISANNYPYGYPAPMPRYPNGYPLPAPHYPRYPQSIYRTPDVSVDQQSVHGGRDGYSSNSMRMRMGQRNPGVIMEQPGYPPNSQQGDIWFDRMERLGLGVLDRVFANEANKRANRNNRPPQRGW